MKKILLIIAAFLPLFVYPTELIGDNNIESDQANIVNSYRKGIYPKFGAGASISTNGFGIHALSEINDKFNVRLGYEHISLKMKKHGISSGGHFYYIHPKYKTGGFSLVGEYKAYRSFYVAAGLVQTTMDVDMKMKLKDDIKFGDITYTPEEVGELNMNLKPKNKVAPYLGVGWYPQNIFRNENLRLNLELGMYYINSFKAKLSGTNMLSSNDNSSVDNFNEEVSSMGWTKFYPVGRISFSYILF